MRTISAREIKRRGIGAVDEAMADGPVHVIRNDEPSYVVMSEAQYSELLEDSHEAYVARVRASLEDVAAGRVRRVTAEQLIDEFKLDATD